MLLLFAATVVVGAASLVILAGGKPFVHRNKIRENATGGIRTLSDSQGKFLDNEIYGKQTRKYKIETE